MTNNNTNSSWDVYEIPGVGQCIRMAYFPACTEEMWWEAFDRQGALEDMVKRFHTKHGVAPKYIVDQGPESSAVFVGPIMVDPRPFRKMKVEGKK